eukprot:1155122-Pelagomonas_calceolata.AAC.2
MLTLSFGQPQKNKPCFVRKTASCKFFAATLGRAYRKRSRSALASLRRTSFALSGMQQAATLPAVLRDGGPQHASRYAMRLARSMARLSGIAILFVVVLEN